MPYSISEDILKLEDKYLTLELEEKGIVDVNTLKEIAENIILWQGDITTLKCDIIVDAGNNQGLGCFNPYHVCIDNIIHTNAGMRLRLECNNILKGKSLSNGEIIICNAYKKFIHDNKYKKLILLELGVGFNTPGIIRFPFEQLAYINDNITLIRINDKYNDMAYELKEAICIKEDCSITIKNILKNC